MRLTKYLLTGSSIVIAGFLAITFLKRPPLPPPRLSNPEKIDAICLAVPYLRETQLQMTEKDFRSFFSMVQEIVISDRGVLTAVMAGDEREMDAISRVAVNIIQRVRTHCSKRGLSEIQTERICKPMYGPTYYSALFDVEVAEWNKKFALHYIKIQREITDPNPWRQRELFDHLESIFDLFVSSPNAADLDLVRITVERQHHVMGLLKRINFDDHFNFD